MSEPTPHLPGADWRKSSLSLGRNNNCVETARIEGAVALRDSQNPAAGALVFAPAEWHAFVDAARRDGFTPIG